ncbi:transcription factor bHLH157-like isoform X2 [Mangifera indica]|uniref:transcription factor bHLH157-like isoform X2 n=1 Tax=Mangifera indica TaxID=29780 RepID=UPI001CFA0C8A|nr:transcription factor bHLH157-like isoform X2 [Mangifera indica]
MRTNFLLLHWFLTLQDAYYEEQMATVVDKMLLEVHMLGEGVIGEVAFTGKHRWMLSDAVVGDRNSICSIVSQDAFQDDSGFHHLFSSGIQTIAVISVESRGVVQFGSTQKQMLERLEFLDQTQKLLQKMENSEGLILLENLPSSLNRETDDLNAIFASIISSGNSFSDNFAPAHDGSSRELKGNPSLLADLNHSSTFTSEIDHRIINSSHLCNEFQIPGREAQALSSEKTDAVYQPLFLPSASVKNLVASTPCISTWSNEDSFLTSFEQLFPSESVIQDSSNLYSAKATALLHNSQGESRLTSAYSTEGLLDVEKKIPGSIGKMMDSQHYAQSSPENKAKLPEMTTNLPGLPEEFKPTDFSNSYEAEDLSQFLSPSQDNILNRTGNTTNNNLLKSIASSSVSSSMVHGNVSVDISTKHPSNSVQSSISDAFVSGGQEKFAIVHDVQKYLFEGLGLDFLCERAGECLEDYIKPVVGGDHSSAGAGMTECVTDLDVGSTGGPWKGLFSQLGLEEILSGVSSSSSVTRCSFEDQLSSTKRRKMESSFSNANQIPLTKLSCCDGSMGLVQPFYNQEMHNLVHKKDFLLKSQVGLLIDDSYSINAEHSAVAPAKKPEKPLKVIRKRARPGESTRPRPKDRQQIQDRLKELRGIIPNGVKCSIDALLDLTIKHMLFLQSITKYADKLKEANEPKMIGKEKGVLLKDNMSSPIGSGGATWAFEVGGQRMVCPIIVEDLSPPGQMLIEMLCEDRGFFLEIADIIRGFGLNIWKGVMEIREDKIWARFIVEANRKVTRMDIFWSLVQLLQQTSTLRTDSTNQQSNAMDVGIPLMPVAASNQLG